MYSFVALICNNNYCVVAGGEGSCWSILMDFVWLDCVSMFYNYDPQNVQIVT